MSDSNLFKLLRSLPDLNSVFSFDELERILNYSDKSKTKSPIEDVLSFKLNLDSHAEFSELQRKLVLTYELADIEKILEQLQKLRGRQSPWKINKKVCA